MSDRVPPVTAVTQVNARSLGSGAIRPKLLDFKLQRNATYRLLGFVAHFNGKFASNWFDDNISGEIKQRLSRGLTRSFLVRTLNPFVILSDCVAIPDIEVIAVLAGAALANLPPRPRSLPSETPPVYEGELYAVGLAINPDRRFRSSHSTCTFE